MPLEIEVICCPICRAYYVVGRDAGTMEDTCPHVRYEHNGVRDGWQIKINAEYREKLAKGEEICR